MQLSELHRFPIRTQVLQLRSEVAALQFQNLLLKCIIEERAYNPNQPRVPAGEPDGGQWTDGGFHRLKPRYDPGRRDDTDAVQVAQNRGGFDPVIRIGNSWLGATPAQQVRLAASQAQANMAIAQVRQVDPAWRPQTGISSPGVEGAIARNVAATREANARLSEFGRPPPEPRDLRDVFFPGGRPIGSQNRGGDQNIRTVDTTQFRELLGELMVGARPTSTPASYAGQWYQRIDGSVIGFRFSNRHGITVDTIRPVHPHARQTIKVHAK